MTSEKISAPGMVSGIFHFCLIFGRRQSSFLPLKKPFQCVSRSMFILCLISSYSARTPVATVRAFWDPAWNVPVNFIKSPLSVRSVHPFCACTMLALRWGIASHKATVSCIVTQLLHHTGGLSSDGFHMHLKVTFFLKLYSQVSGIEPWISSPLRLQFPLHQHIRK